MPVTYTRKPEMESGQHFWPDLTQWFLTQWPDSTRSLSFEKIPEQRLDSSISYLSGNPNNLVVKDLIYIITHTLYTYDKIAKLLKLF